MLELNNREISILVWTGGFLLWAMQSANVRKSVAQLVTALCQSALVIGLGLAGAYVAACVTALRVIGFWEWGNLKMTLLWGVTFALVTMSDVVQSKNGTKSLKGIASETVSATALILFIGEFYVFPLWAELLLVPLLALIGIMLVVAQYKPEHAIVIKPLLFARTAAAVSMIGYSVYRIFQDLAGFATMHTARELGVPILLSLMFLPFLYGLIVYTTYDNVAIRMQFWIKDDRLRRYAFRRAALSFRLDLDLFKRFVRNLKLTDSLDRSMVRRMIHDLRELKRRERNPPLVPWSEGWSPYQAREFLGDQDLLTDDYHLSTCGWGAESPMRVISGGLHYGHLSYRIFGTENAATLLKLALNVNLPGTPDASDATFWDLAVLLLSRAADEEAAALFRRDCANQDEAAMRIGEVTVTVGHDIWGDPQRGGYERRFEICHAAHVTSN